MDQAAFAQQLVAEGFDEILTRSMPAGQQIGAHTHDFEVKALVTQGEVTLGVEGKLSTYHVGDVFTMAKLCEHTERYGDEGVSYVLGRKHK